jgi:succinate-semialdehyde dehydrogenase/glutarate-semialdehyde dehydrogenase
MPIASVNPTTNTTLKSFQPHTVGDVAARIDRAAAAFLAYRTTSFAERAAWMTRAAEILEAEKAELGRLMTAEMGKTLRSASEEAAKCAWACRYYAENAQAFLADEPVATSAGRSYISYQPLGIVLAVMPWNFPFWQVFRFIAPSLMAGNVGLLKHASNVPQCALAIEDIVLRAGFPPGVSQTLLISASGVEQVLTDPRVKAATLTGSEPAGMSVAGIAGREIKKTVLELGGSDPFIVMPSANVEEAAAAAARARCINNGQSCIAAKRFIVHENVYARFAQAFTGALAALRVGDPLLETTDVGPLATEAILADLERQVRNLVAGGAKVLTGGTRLPAPGNFYPPTLLAGIPKDAPGAREEIFGPVALLFSVKDVDEAIVLANDTPFGLGSCAWTNDPEEQRRFVEEIEAGMVFLNSMVVSDPRLPFGGVKRSGYGRELGLYGIREFVNVKSVWIKG